MEYHIISGKVIETRRCWLSVKSVPKIRGQRKAGNSSARKIAANEQEEHWAEVLEDMDIYEGYCETHPDYPNNRAVMAIQNLKAVYQSCLTKNNFL